MKLHLTHETLEAAYELLKTTPPFISWHLPDADDVEFCVTRAKNYCAKADIDTTGVGNHTLNFSARVIGRIEALVPLMAHEMIHIREHQLGARGDVAHGKLFRRLWAQVCRIHGFDEKLFS